MRKHTGYPLLAALLALPLMTTGASAQGAAKKAANEPVKASELKLVYDREVFTYRGAGRRDPFRPLTEDDSMGPRFEELALQGIIYSTGRGRSVALLADGDGRIYRVRAGDRVGNARIVEIGPLRVVLAVENFGTIRQEMLELQKRGGADR